MGKSKFCRIHEFSYNYNGMSAVMIVTSVIGHIFKQDFSPRYNNWATTDPAVLLDAPILEVKSEEVGPVIFNLEQLALRATVLMIWTDCDREGEYIGSEIRTICTSKNQRLIVLRARFSSLTERELHNALIRANPLNEHIVDAVAARREVDFRTGAAFTRLLTLFLQNNFGRLKQHTVSYGTLVYLLHHSRLLPISNAWIHRGAVLEGEEL